MQIGPHPHDEKNLGRIVDYLIAEFHQRWMQDPIGAGPVFFLSTKGPEGRHFVGIHEEFLRVYRSKDMVAALTGRAFASRFRQSKGRRRLLVTRSGLRSIPLDEADAERSPAGPPSGGPRGRKPRPG